MIALDSRETNLLLSLLRSYRKIFDLYENVFNQPLDIPRADLESLISKLKPEEKGEENATN